MTQAKDRDPAPPDPKRRHPEHRDLVTFKTARSPLEAELIANTLRDAGVAAFVAGSLLNDEFAVSQRLMGLNAVTIQVPRASLAQAEAALVEARASGAEVEAAAASAAGSEATPMAPAARGADGEGAGTVPRKGGWLLPLVLAITTVAFLVRWLDTRAALRFASQSALMYLQATDDGTIWRWNDNQQIATQAIDHNANGISESNSWHSRSGKLLCTNYDRDENGVYEKFTVYDAGGQVASISHDADQDGVFEKLEEHRAGDRTLTYLDADQDRRCESIELRDRAGKLLQTLVWHDERGYEVAR